MKCYLNNKTIHIYPMFLMYLGKGSEGVVYKYGDKTLKINYDRSTYPVNDFQVMTSLNTECILLPEELLYDKNMNLMGYTKEYINAKEKEEFYNLNKYDFLQLLYKLREEVMYVSNYKLRLKDWLNINFMYDDKIRMIDPGRYTISVYSSEEIVANLNIEQLNEFCFNEMFYDSIDFDRNNKMGEKLYSKYDESSCDDVISFFEDDMKACTTVKEYIKKYN